MTPTEFRELRARLGLTQAALAARLGVTDRAVRRYEAGDRAIAEPIARLLRSLRKGRAPGER